MRARAGEKSGVASVRTLGSQLGVACRGKYTTGDGEPMFGGKMDFTPPERVIDDETGEAKLLRREVAELRAELLRLQKESPRPGDGPHGTPETGEKFADGEDEEKRRERRETLEAEHHSTITDMVEAADGTPFTGEGSKAKNIDWLLDNTE